MSEFGEFLIKMMQNISTIFQFDGMVQSYSFNEKPKQNILFTILSNSVGKDDFNNLNFILQLQNKTIPCFRSSGISSFI